MAKKGFEIAVTVLLCLLATADPLATQEGRAERPQRNPLVLRPQTMQPAGSPCRFSYAGRWFGDNRILYSVQQEANRLIWSAPSLGARSRGGCEGDVVWAAWTGPLGEGLVRGTAQGHPGGAALVIRWSDQRTFARIPDLSIAADRDLVHPGEPVELVATIDPPDSQISRYFIDFGDEQGEIFQPTATSHVYQRPGVFNVVLTAILFDERFTSPPFQVRVVENLPPPRPSFRLEVDRQRAVVGEEIRLRGVLEPEIPGAVYSFSFGSQTSPGLSSPAYAFRCESEGLVTATANVRFTGGEPFSIDAEPISIYVFSLAAPPADYTWVIELVAGIAVVGMIALTSRRVYRKHKDRKQAQMRLRVKFERSLDTGSQAITPEPEKLCRTELILRPGRDSGRQRAHGLSVTNERQGV